MVSSSTWGPMSASASIPIPNSSVDCTTSPKATAGSQSTTPLSPLIASFLDIGEQMNESDFISGNLKYNFNPMDYLPKFKKILDTIGSLVDGDFLVFNYQRGEVQVLSSLGRLAMSYSPFLWFTGGVDATNYDPNQVFRELLQLLQMGDEQIRRLAENEKEKVLQLEQVLLATRSSVESARRGIEILKKTCMDLSLNVEDGIYVPLLNVIDHGILPSLPRERIPAAIGGPKGFIDRSKDHVYASNELEDVDWKVVRYTEVFLQIRHHAGSIKKEVFGDENSKPESALFWEQEQAQGLIMALQSFLESPDLYTNECTREHLTMLETSNKEYIRKLREIIALTVDQDGKVKCGMEKADLFITRICEESIVGVSLVKESIELVAKCNQWGRGLAPMDPTTMEKQSVDLMKLAHENIKYVPNSALAPTLCRWFNSFRKHWGVGYDAISQSNIPSCIGTLNFNGPEGIKPIKLLAFGTPTMEGIVSYAQVTPEFLGFIRSYYNQGKSHFYIIHQDMIQAMQYLPCGIGPYVEKVRGGVEHVRVQAILDIAKIGKYAEALYCIVLSRNSGFYYQNGEFECQDNAQVFMEELINQHFDMPSKDSGNHFSEKVREKVPDLKEIATAIRDDIYRLFFHEKDTLSKAERQIFLELFQDELVRVLAIKLNVDSMSYGCKDTADRSADSAGRFVANQGIKQQMHLLEGFFKVLQSLLLARAIMVCKRAPIDHRIDRATQNIAFMCEHVDALIQLQKNSPAPYDMIPSFEGIEEIIGDLQHD